MAKRSLTDDQINTLLFEESDTEDLGQLNNEIISDDSSDDDFERNVDSTSDIFRQRKQLTAKRIVNNLEGTLDEKNYNAILPPREKECFTVTLCKATKKNPSKTVTWSNEQPTKVGRQNAANIIKTKGGLINGSNNANTKRKAWELFVTDKMLDNIVKFTNIQIDKIKLNLDDTLLVKNKCFINHTTVEEIVAYIGLIYARGLFGLSKQKYSILFNDEVANPIFGATMSYNRFRFLHSNIKFDDINTRQFRFLSDRFAAMRDFFEQFNDRCSSVLQPDNYLTIDKTLYGCRNQISFKQYNGNKPQKYGLLFKSINSINYPFTFRTSVYSGKPIGEPNGYFVTGIMPIVQSLINQLSRHVDLQGRNITMDRLYTSYELFK